VIQQLTDSLTESRKFIKAEYKPEDDKLQEQITQILYETIRRKLYVKMAEKADLPLVKERLVERYDEMSSFFQMLVDMHKRKMLVGKEVYEKEIVQKYGSNLSETIPKIYGDLALDAGVENIDTDVVWKHRWKDFENGDEAIMPIALCLRPGQAITNLANEFSGNVSILAQGDLPKLKKEKDDKPSEVKVINFDPEVAKLIMQDLKRLGVERSITQLEYIKFDHMDGFTYNATAKTGNVVLRAFPEQVTVEGFQKTKASIISIFLHEDFHSLMNRVRLLSDVDKLRVAEQVAKIKELIDPIRDLSRVFPVVDSEDLGGYYKINDTSLTDYYLRGFVIDPFAPLKDKSNMVQNLYGEFNVIMKKLLNVKIDDFFEGDFFELNKIMKVALEDKGVAGLFALQVLKNYKGIMSAKRWTTDKIDKAYFVNYVLPMVMTNMVVYENTELNRAIDFDDNDEITRKMAKSYCATIRKRIRESLDEISSEELLADWYAASLYEDEEIPRSTALLEIVRPMFLEILGFMKTKGLAFEDTKNTLVS